MVYDALFKQLQYTWSLLTGACGEACFSWTPGAPWPFLSPGFGGRGGRYGHASSLLCLGPWGVVCSAQFGHVACKWSCPFFLNFSECETGSQFLTKSLCIWRCWAPLVRTSCLSAQPGVAVWRVFCCSGPVALWKAVICASFSALDKGGVLSALSDRVWYTAESCSEEETALPGQAFSIAHLPKCPLIVLGSGVSWEIVSLQADLADVLLNCSPPKSL